MKTLLSTFLLLICLGNVGTAQQQGQNSYSLKQSIEIAQANNLQVKQSEFQSLSAGVALRQAKSNVFPDISANINHGLNQGRSIDPFTNGYVNENVSYANYGLNGGVTLFSGLILRNQIKQSSYEYQASIMEQQQAKDNLTLKVIITYFQILNNEDQVNQALLQNEVTCKQIDRLQILYKEGAIAPAQLSDLKGQLANDELSLINSRNSLNSSKIALAELMNVAYTREFNVDRMQGDAFSKKPRDSPEDIYALALEQLASIKGAALRRKSAVQGIKVAKGLSSPQLSLNSNLFSNYSSAATGSKLISTQNLPTGDYVELSGTKLPVVAPQDVFERSKIAYSNQLRNNYSSSYNLSLRIPIFNSDRTRNRIALARIELNNAELVEETTKLQLKQAVDLAWINKTAADERLQALNKQVVAFKESFKSAEIRFNAGVGSAVDYTIAKNNLDRASINLINAKYDLLLRAKILDYYKGELSL